MKKGSAMITAAIMMSVGYGMYRYYKSHTYEIQGCVKDTMNKMKNSMKEMDKNMM